METFIISELSVNIVEVILHLTYVYEVHSQELGNQLRKKNDQAVERLSSLKGNHKNVNSWWCYSLSNKCRRFAAYA